MADPGGGAGAAAGGGGTPTGGGDVTGTGRLVLCQPKAPGTSSQLNQTPTTTANGSNFSNNLCTRSAVFVNKTVILVALV